MTTLPLQATPMTTTVCTSTARARTPTSSTSSWTGTMWSWRRRGWFRIEKNICCQSKHFLIDDASSSSSLHRCGTLGGSDHHKREVKNRNPTVRYIILHFIMLILCNTNNVHILSMCHPRCAIMNGLMLPPVQCWCCNQYWLLLEYLLHIFVINYLRAVIWPPLALVLITRSPVLTMIIQHFNTSCHIIIISTRLFVTVEMSDISTI